MDRRCTTMETFGSKVRLVYGFISSRITDIEIFSSPRKAIIGLWATLR